MLENKKKKGSVLVFSLLILSIMLIAALGIAMATVSARKDAGATGKSAQAYQLADSGMEIVMKSLYSVPPPLLNYKVGDVGTTICDDSNYCTMGCASTPPPVHKIRTVTFHGYSDSVKVTFMNSAGDELDCNALIKNADSTPNVAKIKSVGTYNGVSRAVEISLAP